MDWRASMRLLGVLWQVRVLSAETDDCHSGGLRCAQKSSAARGVRPEPHDCEVGHENVVSAWSHVKQKWCCEHVGVACDAAESSGPPADSALFDCEVGGSVAARAWSTEKREWCCGRHHERRERWGCAQAARETRSRSTARETRSTTSLPYNCHVGYGRWETAWASGKKAWCCQNTGRGCPRKDRTQRRPTTTDSHAPAPAPASPTTTTAGPPHPCETPCHLEGVSATCSARIQWAAAHEFGHQANPCRWAHSLVSQQCSVCMACTVAAAKCEAPSPAKQPAAEQPKAAPAPAAAGCDAVCDFEGKSASCKFRVSWAARHNFAYEKKAACSKAYSLVRKQCPACSGCSLADASCVEEDTPKLPKAADIYDCAAGLSNWKVSWSSLKKSWCCSHEKKGCASGEKAAAPTAMIVAQALGRADGLPSAETEDGTSQPNSVVYRQKFGMHHEVAPDPAASHQTGSAGALGFAAAAFAVAAVAGVVIFKSATRGRGYRLVGSRSEVSPNLARMLMILPSSNEPVSDPDGQLDDVLE